MTTILIVTILGSIAVPSFRTYTLNTRIGTTTSELVTAMHYARSEAIRRASRVEICASSNRTTCSGSLTWTQGWIVFDDANGDGAAAASELLRVWEPAQGNVTVTGDVDNAIYTGMGMAMLPGGAASANFLTTHSYCRDGNARVSALSLSGSLQTQKTTNTCP